MRLFKSPVKNNANTNTFINRLAHSTMDLPIHIPSIAPSEAVALITLNTKNLFNFLKMRLLHNVSIENNANTNTFDLIQGLTESIWQILILNYLIPAEAISLMTTNSFFYRLLTNKNLDKTSLAIKFQRGYNQFFFNSDKIHHCAHGYPPIYFYLFSPMDKPEVYAWGNSYEGQLATGNWKKNERFTTCRLPKEFKIVDGIVISYRFTFIYGRKQDQHPIIYASGANNDGQLAIGDYKKKNRFTPCLLPQELRVIDGMIINSSSTFLYGRDQQQKPLLYRTGVYDQDKEVNFNYFIRCQLPEELMVINGIATLKGVYSNVLIYGIDQFENPIICGPGNNHHGQSSAIGHYELATQFTNRFLLPKQLTVIKGVATNFSCSYVNGLDQNYKPLFLATRNHRFQPLPLSDNKDACNFTFCSVPEEVSVIEGLLISEAFICIYGYNQNKIPLFFAAERDSTHDKQRIFSPCVLPDELTVIDGIIDIWNHLLVYGRKERQKVVLYDFTKSNEQHNYSFQDIPLPDNLTVIEDVTYKEPKRRRTSGSMRIFGRDRDFKPVIYKISQNLDEQHSHAV